MSLVKLNFGSRKSVKSVILSLLFLLGAATIVTGCNESDITIPEGCKPQDFGQASLPEATPQPSPSQAPPQKVVVDPESLRKLLFEGNTSILLSLNRIHQAKEEVNVARGNLLPSINLGALLQMAGSGGFTLASVEFLLPFLLPSRWFEYFQVKNLLQADKVALQIVKVNEYASAYSLHQMIRTDLELKSFLEAESADLDRIEAYVQRAYDVGMATKSDLDLAKGRASSARVNLSKVKTLVSTEIASFRHALGLSLETQLEVANVDVPRSGTEGQTPIQVLDSAMVQSLESRQIGFLERAAESATWTKIFGFINSASLRGVAGPGGGSSAFSNLGVSGSVGIGFAYFPSIRLSQLNEDSMKIRQQELRLEVAEALERTLGTLGETQLRLVAAEKAKSAFYDAYISKKEQYEIGLADLIQMIQAQSFYRDAAIEVLRTKLQLGLDRIALQRVMLEYEFERIPGCSFVEPKSSSTAAAGVL